MSAWALTSCVPPGGFLGLSELQVLQIWASRMHRTHDSVNFPRPSTLHMAWIWHEPKNGLYCYKKKIFPCDREAVERGEGGTTVPVGTCGGMDGRVESEVLRAKGVMDGSQIRGLQVWTGCSVLALPDPTSQDQTASPHFSAA